MFLEWKAAVLGAVCCLAFGSCKKEKDSTPEPTTPPASPSVVADALAARADGPFLPDGPLTDAPAFTTYLILAGQNYCVGNSYDIDTFRGMRFEAVFDSSCIYATADPGNQADINKLMGFSDSASHHQRHSARFGWNWEAGGLYIYAYCYRGGVRASQKICTVGLGEVHEYRIELRAGQYFFSVDGGAHTATMPRAAQEPYAFGYKLLPYFGGDEPAPHDVRIRVRELE